MDTISIISSLYRTDKHLKRFLKDAYSLSNELNKHNQPHEIILVINDATDLEKSLVSHLPAEFRPIFVIRESIYASWNRGIRESRGKFITFWGVDDTRLANAIISGLDTFRNPNIDVTYFPFRYHRFVKFLGITLLAKIKTFHPPAFERSLFQREMHLGPHFIVRKNVFNRIGYFDETYKIAGDFAWQVMAAKAGVKFALTNTISGIFRNDGTTLSGSKSLSQHEENAGALS